MVVEELALDGHLVLLKRILAHVVCVGLVHAPQYHLLRSGRHRTGRAEQELHPCQRLEALHHERVRLNLRDTLEHGTSQLVRLVLLARWRDLRGDRVHRVERGSQSNQLICRELLIVSHDLAVDERAIFVDDEQDLMHLFYYFINYILRIYLC